MEEIRRILVIGEDMAVHDAYGRIENASADAETFSRSVKGSCETRDPRKQGFRFSFSTDAENAMDLVRRSIEEANPFSVAFIHMKREGHDGLGIARRIRKRDPDLKVVVACDYRESSWEELVGVCEKESLFFQRKNAPKNEIIQFAELLAGLWVLETEKKRIDRDLITAGLNKGMNPALADERFERVSHLLRTPIASILGFCDTILADRNMPEEVRVEFLKIIRMEGKRLHQLIDNLRDIS